MSRKGKVYVNERLAGIISEHEEGYTFEYDMAYLSATEPESVSLTLPLTHHPYHSKVLFPFFDGLIPEGWLLDIGVKNWKLNPRDRMELLLALCKDCIGDVSVEPFEKGRK